MQKVSIETTQNVLINYTTAGLGDRIGAFVIDILIIIAYYITIGLLAYFAGDLLNTVFGSTDAKGAIAFSIFIGLVPFFYYLLSEIFMDGQSLGKKLVKIKVVKLDGSQPSLGSYILRWIIWPVDILFYGGIAIMCILIGDKGQRLGDLAAGTAVIKIKPMQRTDKHRVVKSLGDESYQPSYYEVEKLSEENIRIINDSLKMYRTTANIKPVDLVAQKIKELINVSSNMSNVQFLNIVLKDYNYLAIYGR